MQNKKIVAFGDSFTRGDELADCPTQSVDNSFSAHMTKTWTALIAKSLNCDYACWATGGVGNQFISWQVCSQIKKDAVFIVNWTWFERFDYVDVLTDRWTTTHPRHADKLDHYFYRNLDNDVWNLYRNLQQIHSTISLLKQNNINFIMTCLDPQYSLAYYDLRPPEIKRSRWTNAILNLQEQILPHIVDFDGMNFLEWSKHNSFELGPNGHPLEHAHSKAANYILDKCNKYLYNKRIE